MAVLADGHEYTVIDNLRPQDAKPTEAAGTVRFGESGVLKTKNKALADELQAKYPGIRVVAHEPQTGGRAMRIMWSVPEMPWKKEKETDGDREELPPDDSRDGTDL